MAEMGGLVLAEELGWTPLSVSVSSASLSRGGAEAEAGESSGDRGRGSIGA